MSDLFLDQLVAISERCSGNTALWQNGQEALIYAELWHQVEEHGSALQVLGVKPGDRVAISYERSQEFVLALLACWHAGAVWLPVGGLPDGRRKQLLEKSEAKLVLGPHDTALEALPKATCKPRVNLSPESPAYLIFTSGSSGTPKGVLIPHAGIVTMLQSQIALFELNPADRSLWLLSPLFDASVSDIGTALLSGACLVIDAEPLHSLEHFYHLLKQFQINYLDLPPALMNRLELDKLPESLRTVVIGGEVADFQHVQIWSQKLRLINVYGPTEATVCTSAHRWRAGDLPANLGHELQDVCYGIDGPDLFDGQQGELWIHSPGLALGYWQDPALTASRFIIKDNRRWYRSGDLIRFEQGQFLFCGRIDRQFKYLGRLICPEEIEHALLQFVGIEQVCVGMNPSGVLLACLKGQQTSGQALQDYLSSLLPRWMIPKYFIWPDPWLSTTSGKPDIQALLRLPISTNKPEDLFLSESAFDLAQQTLIQIWQHLFPNQIITAQSHFFELGGSSIDVLSCVARAAEAGLYLNPECFYRNGILQAIVQDSTHSQKMSTSELKTSVESLVHSQTLPIQHSDIQNLFLTGATGFLGSRLLVEILAQTDWQITCLIRAHDSELAWSRLQAALDPWRVKADRSRIDVICGDLTESGYLQQLLQTPDALLHCAATVDLVRDYHSLFSANVKSLLPLLSLNCPIHFVSSLSVLVSAEPRPVIALECDELSQHQAVYGGYAQSKWAAEWFLRQSMTQQDRWIYRPGLITADSKSGIGPNKDWLNYLIQGLIEIGTLPEILDSRFAIDITPVDYVAQAIIHLMQRKAGTYHLANPVPLTLQKLIESLAQSFDLPILEQKQWRSIASGHLRRHPDSRSSTVLLALCQALDGAYWHSLDLFQATDIQLAANDTWQHLNQALIQCPAPNSNLIELYINSLKKE